jgi:hypothetical protein
MFSPRPPHSTARRQQRYRLKHIGFTGTIRPNNQDRPSFYIYFRRLIIAKIIQAKR